MPTVTPAADRSAMSQAQVSVRDVGKSFASRSGVAVVALEQVSLEIPPGAFISVVGPSGCGKSTLLLAVAGLERPTSGSIWVEGEEVKGPFPRMGIAFQRDSLLEWRTVLDNILLQADLRGRARSSHIERAQHLLHMVGLEPFASHYPRELSGGMRQRVALCRALLHEPTLLLLDEPFGAVDALTREQLNVDVSSICQVSDVTTMLVTHDINEAVFMADRVVVMTSRPGTVAGIVEVDAPKPRSHGFRTDPEFLRAASAVRELLEATGGFTR
ncbi:MAG: ABC transporter ATP-binding protein [Actinomycetota bacterium]|nr:ABC transporter ATP-binding protein [Actinomycetota bacterium]